MQGLLRLSAWIDALNSRIGRWAAWLILVAVLISAGNALIRKIFDMSSNAWLEMQWQLFSAVFLLCSPYTLLRNEHIRIDILNQGFPQRLRNWIDLLGHFLFLMPFVLLMVYFGWPFFWASYSIGEQSGSAGGLAQWPAKLLVPLGFALLALQGVSEIIKRVAVMRGLIEDPHAGQAGAGHAVIE